MFTTLVNAFKDKGIRKKIFITLGLLFIFRLGCWLPIPGITTETFRASIKSQDFLSLLNGIGGGALANGTFFALGVTPYINASIILQLLTFAIPKLQRLSQMGEEGRKKIAKYTKYAALFLAIAQAVGICVGFSSSIELSLFGTTLPTWLACTFVAICLIAGAMLTYWLGEKITEIGVANGLSILIFVGILSTAGTAILASFKDVFAGNIDGLWNILLFFGAAIVIFGLIVFMDLAERKVQVQYAKQIKGRKMYGGQSNFIPIRLMGTGVLPIIFAMSFLSLPQLIMSMFWPTSKAATWYAMNLGAGTWPYTLVMGILILLFAFFTSQMMFNPEDVAKQIQSNGGFILGIRPGKPTADYLKRINNRITLFGAIFLAFIAIVPTLIFTFVGGSSSLINAFSATGMLIVVSVALEFNKQLEAQILTTNYKGFLK
ncbi:MAG: preprotein translocase subunit SecY [Clostridiales bacterium]|nr:preprotein translocase subunit SecY [Clostridiales bacterium]